MRLQFVAREDGPERLACEAEVVFEIGDNVGPLVGLKITGFQIWRSADGGFYVTVPTRPWGVSTERRYFDYIRKADEAGSVQALKDWIIEEFLGRRRGGVQR